MRSNRCMHYRDDAWYSSGDNLHCDALVLEFQVYMAPVSKSTVSCESDEKQHGMAEGMNLVTKGLGSNTCMALSIAKQIDFVATPVFGAFPLLPVAAAAKLSFVRA